MFVLLWVIAAKTPQMGYTPSGGVLTGIQTPPNPWSEGLPTPDGGPETPYTGYPQGLPYPEICSKEDMQ